MTPHWKITSEPRLTPLISSEGASSDSTNTYKYLRSPAAPALVIFYFISSFVLGNNEINDT